MKIGHKLKLNSLVVLALLTAIIAVAIFSIFQIQKDVRQLAEVEEPLEQAILEMEINAGEAARAVLHYVWNPEERDLDKIHDSKRDFERYAREFERLAETEEERVLGREVMENYREFKTLSDEITSIAKRRLDDLQRFRRAVTAIGALIDEKLHPAIDRSAADALTKLEAVLFMEINIGEAFAAIEGYILLSKPELKRVILDAEAGFKRFEAQYRGTRISADEKQWLDVIDETFAEAVTAGNEIIGLTDRLREKLEKFEEVLGEIDRTLDDEIQVLIQEETRRAAKDARDAGEKAITVMVVVGLMIFWSMAGVNWFVSRGIVDGVNRLSEGAMEFGRGNLDHRVEVQTKDELGALADAFNMMADRRKRDDATLKEKETNFRTTLLNSIGDAVISTDAAGGVTHLNPVAEKLTGWETSAAEGRPLTEVFHIVNAETREPAINPVYRLLEEGKIVGLADHTMLIARDGTKYQIADSGAPIRDDAANINGVVLVFRDVTESKRLEAQLRQAQKLEALGWLAGGIAHDFNNILMPIITITDVCRDDLPADGELSRKLEKVVLAAQRGRALVDQILKFSRRQPLERRSVDLREVVEEALKLARATVPSMIEIRSHFDAAAGKVLADSNQIHEAVVNLITNAAYAIGTKKGIIGVALREAWISGSADGVPVELEPGTYACLTISDTGAGMEEETLAHIFDPFFTTKPFGEGTGMGLAAVHGIVTGHGGAIAVSSQPRIGTTFEIYLPVIEMAATAPSAVEATEEFG